LPQGHILYAVYAYCEGKPQKHDKVTLTLTVFMFIKCCVTSFMYIRLIKQINKNLPSML